MADKILIKQVGRFSVAVDPCTGRQITFASTLLELDRKLSERKRKGNARHEHARRTNPTRFLLPLSGGGDGR